MILGLDTELKIILEHLKFGKLKSDTYLGRNSLLKIVYDHIRQEKIQHLLLTEARK